MPGLHIFILLLYLSNTLATNRWAPTISVLQKGIDDRVFPGAVALVGNAHGPLLRVALGNLTYDGVPTPQGQKNLPTTIDTIFDMASCSKVTATTTAVALLFGAGDAALDTPISQHLPGYEAQGKGPITVRNCLLHNAGLPPDPTPHDYWDPAFGCESAPLPSNQNFQCSERIYTSLLQQTLRPNAAIGGAYVYSDLSFITLMYVVGTVALQRGLVTDTDFLPRCTKALSVSSFSTASRYDANDSSSSSSNSSSNRSRTDGLSKQCAFEAFVRLHVFKPLNMPNTGYLPNENDWSKCQPTWIPDGEPGMRGHALQGQVEDGNAYNMGGIAGHAGIFSTVDDLSALMRTWMQFDASFLTKDTIELFIKINNHSQSSRALGWNTNDITAQPDGGWNLSCGNLSKETFTHVGFTGTQLCGDPVNQIYTVLLTARVYGSPNTENSTGIHAVRKAFNSEVAKVLDRKVGLL
jgi:CubicO group peptidase (beta-lactamase class C family)